MTRYVLYEDDINSHVDDRLIGQRLMTGRLTRRLLSRAGETSQALDKVVTEYLVRTCQATSELKWR